MKWDLAIAAVTITGAVFLAISSAQAIDRDLRNWEARTSVANTAGHAR